jgi:hypothetical protein
VFLWDLRRSLRAPLKRVALPGACAHVSQARTFCTPRAPLALLGGGGTAWPSAPVSPSRARAICCVLLRGCFFIQQLPQRFSLVSRVRTHQRLYEIVLSAPRRGPPLARVV